MNKGTKLTRQEEKDEPVHDQDWPEHWNIEHLEPSADETNQNSTGSGVPEFEFRKSSNEGAEFVVLLRRKRRSSISIF